MVWHSLVRPAEDILPVFAPPFHRRALCHSFSPDEMKSTSNTAGQGVAFFEIDNKLTEHKISLKGQASLRSQVSYNMITLTLSPAEGNLTRAGAQATWTFPSWPILNGLLGAMNILRYA